MPPEKQNRYTNVEAARAAFRRVWLRVSDEDRHIMVDGFIRLHGVKVLRVS